MTDPYDENDTFKRPALYDNHPIVHDVANTPGIQVVFRHGDDQRFATVTSDLPHNAGITLTYTRNEWDAFTKGVKAGEFDLEPPNR